LVPSLRGKTLVDSSKDGIGWPDIPSVRYSGILNSLRPLDFGRRFIGAKETGIVDEPPRPGPGERYAVLVPRVDADGNELAGVRSVGLMAPIGTYTGWNLRKAGFAEDEQCGLSGSFIPFAKTRAERAASGDPR